MTEIHTIDPKMSVLSGLFTAATEHASEAMCKWTNGQISLSLEALHEIELDQVPTELNIDDDLLTMIVFHLLGDLGGQLILTFDEENGRQLAASLLGREVNQEAEWSELEKSALNETGNILSCAYMKVLTEVINADLVPGAPHFVQDYGAIVLEQAVMAQAMVSDTVLICRTVFRRQDECLNWRVFFVPTEELLLKLEGAIESGE